MVITSRTVNVILNFSISLAGCLYGYNIGAISGILLFVQKQMLISHAEASFFVSAFLWGIVFAMIASGLLAEKFGRKKIILFGVFTEIISIFVMGSSSDIHQLMIGRFMIGVSCGLITFSAPIYLTETLPEHIRGRGTVAYQLFITFGILFATIVCWYYVNSASWRAVVYIELLPAIFLLSIAFLIPESPRWLALQGKMADAVRVLALTRNKESAEAILNEISQRQTDHYRISHIKAIFKKEFIVPLVLAILLGTLNQLTGINAFLQYDAVILLKSGFDTHNAALTGSLLIAGLNFLMTIPSMYFADHFERKKLLRCTLIGVIFCLAGLVASSLLINSTSVKGVLVTALLLGFIACFAAGPGALIWTLRSEILPTKIRSIGLSLSLIMSSSAGALFSATFLPLQHRIGLDGIFIFCACIALLYFGLTFFLPKTSQRSLEEIEKHFIEKA
jgi:SP family arabinose:H+ symporter-like MFS transporter